MGFLLFLWAVKWPTCIPAKGLDFVSGSTVHSYIVAEFRSVHCTTSSELVKEL